MFPRLHYQSSASDRIPQSPYDTWLAKVLSATAKSVGNDDNTLIEFLLDLPELTPDVLQGIRRIAENVDT
jgi:hypothetical protein